MSLNGTLLVLTALLTTACGFGSFPDEQGNYSNQFPKTPLSNQICQVDSDCVITPYHDGSCCPKTCNEEPHVFNKDTFETMRAHQKDICKDLNLRCPKTKCSRPLFDRVATCTEGHCTIEKVWPERTKQKAKAPTKSKGAKKKGGKRKGQKRKGQKRR